MKILYCSYSQIPSVFANSIAVMKQCEALSNQSELQAILIKGDKEETKDVFSAYGVNAFPLLLLPKWMLLFQELGLKVFVVLYALLYRPDVVYSRDILLNDWLCRFHIKNICEVHQLDQEHEDFDLLYKKTLARIMKQKDLHRIVCISESLANECIDFGVPKDKVAVMHSGVDLSECDDVEKVVSSHFTHKDSLAVYAGSLNKGKGVEQIIQMAELSPDINYLIVGGNAGQIKERNNLKHIPRVSHKKAIAYMKSADFLLLPMTEQNYKFHSPLKLFEYLAVGKPVIASDNEDIREIITPMENGMLADSEKPEEFIRIMEQVRDQPRLSEHLEKNAKHSAAQYSWEARADKIINLIWKQ